MKKYTSVYTDLAFYVDGKRKKFSGGEYEATTKAEETVLDKIVCVSAVETPAKKTAAAKKDA